MLFSTLIKMQNLGARGMAQLLKALAAVAEDPGLVTISHVEVHNQLYRHVLIGFLST